MRHARRIIHRLTTNQHIKQAYHFLKTTSERYIYPRLPRAHNFFFTQLKNHARRYALRALTNNKTPNGNTPKTLYAQQNKKHHHPKVSVIVPNYCHSPYLRARLDSIYGQTYKNLEVILLDDASTDDSTKILDEYASRHPDITRCIFNKTNSGSAFAQWKKGIEAATGDLIWIAESDDYCTENFLERMVDEFSNQGVMISYCQSIFIDGETGKQTWSIQEYLSDIDSTLWSHDFILSAHNLVNMAWAKKNIIPNASSAVFRHPGRMTLLNDETWQAMKVCGDWVFYLHLARGGLVSYTTDAINSYRIHNKNTSIKNHNKCIYYQEHERVAQELLQLYRVSDEALYYQQKIMESHWALHGAGQGADKLGKCYDLNRVRQHVKERKPNIMMASLAFSTGGGETFPILLANLLHTKGYSITFLNCQHSPTVPGVRHMLNPSIPVIELNSLENLREITRDMGIDIIHSHHAWVDSSICSLLEDAPEPAIVITTHGMYELIEEADRIEAVNKLKKSAFHIVYVADKNLDGFRGGGIEPSRFTRIDNALPIYPTTPIDRLSLGIPQEAFVLCLASRAIPEKGWNEAITIIEMAREMACHDIHLVLAGDGPEYQKLSKKTLPAYVHPLGFRSDVRSLFAMADMGFLPSRFRGESAPLVVIECLHAGRPMLASDVGEIRRMLSTNKGLAGSVIPLLNGHIPIGAMASEIARFSCDRSYYDSCLKNVPDASLRFSTEPMLEKYERVYSSCLNRTHEFCID